MVSPLLQRVESVKTWGAISPTPQETGWQLVLAAHREPDFLIWEGQAHTFKGKLPFQFYACQPGSSSYGLTLTPPAASSTTPSQSWQPGGPGTHFEYFCFLYPNIYETPTPMPSTA